MNYIVHVFILQINLNIQEYVGYFLPLRLPSMTLLPQRQTWSLSIDDKATAPCVKKLQRSTMPKQYKIFKTLVS